MRVLQVHNFYQQPGGEDRVLAAEQELLTAHGHTVRQYLAHNDSLRAMPAWRVAAGTLWNQDSYRAIRQLLRSESIDLVHAHNTFPLLSPSVYYAARAERVPVVQTLHNYRLLCPAATFFRAGAICEQCQSRLIPYPAALHRCYRGSASASAITAAMLTSHRIAGTFTTRVDAYIALTDFAKNKFADGGLPAERIHVKPGFVAHDPGCGSGAGGYGLFIGRLAEEKGVRCLLDAWEQYPNLPPLKIAGDGPLRSFLEERLSSLPNVSYLGARPHADVLALLGEAAFLVLPSLWYEGFPMVAIEALARGTPIVASALGSLNEVIEDGVNGFRCVASSATALADCVAQAFPLVGQLRTSTRASFEKNYTAARNYDILMPIYAAALHGSNHGVNRGANRT